MKIRKYWRNLKKKKKKPGIDCLSIKDERFCKQLQPL